MNSFMKKREENFIENFKTLWKKKQTHFEAMGCGLSLYVIYLLSPLPNHWLWLFYGFFLYYPYNALFETIHNKWKNKKEFQKL